MPQAPKSFQQVLAELWELLKAYAKQETVGPLKNLGRQLGFGVAGTLSFCLGYFLIVLAVMRFLQTHTRGFLFDFTEHNYTTYFVAVIMLAAACAWAGLKARGPKDATDGPGGGPPSARPAADPAIKVGPTPAPTTTPAVTAPVAGTEAPAAGEDTTA